MKIGILTFHRFHNYGAVLQCYALQQTLLQMGHEVEVIDYRQPWIEAYNNSFSMSGLKMAKGLLNKLRYLKHYPSRERLIKPRRLIFRSFCDKYLITSKSCCCNSIPQDYDAYVIGSDQLWSKNCLGGNLDSVYFGDFKKKNNRVIGYAISTNDISIDNVCNYLHTYKNNFEILSLREEFAFNRIHKEFPELCLSRCVDPVLLTNTSKWDAIINNEFSNRNYIALYQVRAPMGFHVLKEKAQELANKYNYEVIDLSSCTYKVEDFVSIIKYARCVITSSFHASVFSAIFGVPCYCYKLNDGKDARYVDLYKQLELDEYIVDLEYDVKEIANYSSEKTEKLLEKLRVGSLNFLKQI